MDVGQMIRAERERREWTLGQLSDRSGVSKSYLSRIEQGGSKRLGAKVARKLADTLGLSYDELTGEQTGPPSAQVFGGVVYVPVVKYTPVSAGSGNWIDTADRIPARADLQKPGRRLVAFTVTGTCLSPEVNPGDAVIVDLNRNEPQPGEMIVCVSDGELLVKYFYRDDTNRVVLESHNDPDLYPKQLVVHGVVLEIDKKVGKKPRRQRR